MHPLTAAGIGLCVGAVDTVVPVVGRELRAARSASLAAFADEEEPGA